ncbi:MAG: NADH-quinone oxidoreductase subunit D [Candidatus Micrarchaeota archaeon]|nr:NADH-quinone oxidoreductase subunit D [Candidatus Micrarchaeota archaeon]MDE1824303.1 NADH-quinone oxidoreductase subunit D [Candidatus Micrarchaeota archaeon]MDE1849750.1 NADH-quinone oxidoreductase subunit D [Candidatus Micrarchaeota archaeon]
MAITRINIGPVHPSTHGVLRLVVDLDGDMIERVETHIGFLHRGVEKLVETRMYMQSPAYMEKLDYVAPLSYDEAYVAVVEKALGIEVKERAQYARVILLELQRIASHLLWLGTMCNDLGQMFTVFMWSFKDRDMVLKLLEEASGNRMFYVNVRLGGLQRELPPDFEAQTLEVMDYMEKRTAEYERYIERNPVFMERMKGVGVLSSKDAKDLGVTGPVLRASGVEYDVRKNNPYYVYENLHFSMKSQEKGDNFSRYRVRIMEIKESIRLIREAFGRMPASGDMAGMPIRLRSPEPVNKVSKLSRELPRGECLMYMVADPQKPYRLSIRSPSFINLAALSHIAKGQRLADLFAILGSLDLVMGCVDR